jgi:hypothetical protein
MKIIIPILAICLNVSGFCAEDAKTEKSKTEDSAPKGYSWCEAPHVGVSILKPDGWYVCEPELHDTTYVFKISRETPEEGFHTGLTLNIVRNVKEKTKVQPTLYAAHFIGQKQKSAKQIELFDFVELAKGIKRCGITVEQEQTVRDITQKYTVHHTIFANDNTDTLYIFTFGTPSSKWEEDQDIWNTMNQLKLNPNL